MTCQRCGEIAAVENGLCRDELWCDVRWLILRHVLSCLWGRTVEPLIDIDHDPALD